METSNGGSTFTYAQTVAYFHFLEQQSEGLVLVAKCSVHSR